jgi:hypothetical protein
MAGRKLTASRELHQDRLARADDLHTGNFLQSAGHGPLVTYPATFRMYSACCGVCSSQQLAVSCYSPRQLSQPKGHQVTQWPCLAIRLFNQRATRLATSRPRAWPRPEPCIDCPLRRGVGRWGRFMHDAFALGALSDAVRSPSLIIHPLTRPNNGLGRAHDLVICRIRQSAAPPHRL